MSPGGSTLNSERRRPESPPESVMVTIEVSLSRWYGRNPDSTLYEPVPPPMTTTERRPPALNVAAPPWRPRPVALRFGARSCVRPTRPPQQRCQSRARAAARAPRSSPPCRAALAAPARDRPLEAAPDPPRATRPAAAPRSSELVPAQPLAQARDGLAFELALAIQLDEIGELQAHVAQRHTERRQQIVVDRPGGRIRLGAQG